MRDLPKRIYDAKMMRNIADLYESISEAITDFEPPGGGETTPSDPLYVNSLEIVIRHHDGYTIGRIGMDDFLFFELTDEGYVSEADEAKKEGAAAMDAHIRQEDTASGATS